MIIIPVKWAFILLTNFYSVKSWCGTFNQEPIFFGTRLKTTAYSSNNTLLSGGISKFDKISRYFKHETLNNKWNCCSGPRKITEIFMN